MIMCECIYGAPALFFTLFDSAQQFLKGETFWRIFWDSGQVHLMMNSGVELAQVSFEWMEFYSKPIRDYEMSISCMESLNKKRLKEISLVWSC